MKINIANIKKTFTWKVAICLSLILSGLLVFLYIADEAVVEQEKMFDNWAISFFDSITSAGLISVMKVFTFLGSASFMIPFYLLLVTYYFVKKNFLFGVFIVLL